MDELPVVAAMTPAPPTPAVVLLLAYAVAGGARAQSLCEYRFQDHQGENQTALFDCPAWLGQDLGYVVWLDLHECAYTVPGIPNEQITVCDSDTMKLWNGPSREDASWPRASAARDALCAAYVGWARASGRMLADVEGECR